MSRALHWFRNDIREHDNPALLAACEHEEVAACFIATPAQWMAHDWSPARRALLADSLTVLARQLDTKGIPMISREVPDFAAQADTLLALCVLLKIDRVYCNAEYGFNERLRDERISGTLAASGISFHCMADQAAVPVGRVLKADGSAYAVFTPFKRKWHTEREICPLTPSPAPSKRQKRVRIPAADILPGNTPDWLAHQNTPILMSGGEKTAHLALESFLNHAALHYDQTRNVPALAGTSKLSPWLSSGVLTGRQCLYMLETALRQHGGSNAEGLETWRTELIWRDFYIHLLYHHPRLSKHQPWRLDTDRLPWRGEGPDFERWCQGRTGVPIVDAAMRQLNQTGWMHNRLRMISAMFLTKNLFVDWRFGERYFMRNLVDGYLPSNNGGWQWCASTGTDAAPYFRIFNPVTQSERFDPKGIFIRHFLPELRKRSDRQIHQAFESGVAGEDYPPVIVDLGSSRKAAIETFKCLQ